MYYKGISIFVRLMGSSRHAIIWIVTILSVLAFAIACSPQRKLATEFTKDKTKRIALLFVPSGIYKTSLKTEILDSLGITDNSKNDSVLFANSEFLQFVNDSLFIANYKLGFERELSQFGFEVFDENEIATFMNIDSASAYVINVAQLEMEEVYYTLRDETVLYEMYYYHDHNINGVYINSWFEISEVNDSIKNDQVYFASDIITDDVEGDFGFNIFSGGVNYSYQIDSLKTNELYEFGFLLGRTYAGYTYDLLLNRYLKARIPQTSSEEEYLRYDPYYNNFFPATDDRFIPLDE